MTLDTRIFVLDPVDPVALFRRCQELLAEHDTQGRAANEQLWTDRVQADGTWEIGNQLGQGLPAWLIIQYQHDGPYRTPEQSAAHDLGICDGDCDGSSAWTHAPACAVEIMLDTAYGYRGAVGGCGDLHARLIADLGVWLVERQVNWSWLNEFTGELHHRFAGLVDLGSQGAASAAWFRNIAFLLWLLRRDITGPAGIGDPDEPTAVIDLSEVPPYVLIPGRWKA